MRLPTLYCYHFLRVFVLEFLAFRAVSLNDENGRFDENGRKLPISDENGILKGRVYFLSTTRRSINKINIKAHVFIYCIYGSSLVS